MRKKWILIALLCLPAVGSTIPAAAVDDARKAYNKMVEEATREADEYLQEKEKRMKASEAKAQSQQDRVVDERVQAERKRIETEMDAIRDRGLGSGFTQGMKDNLLQQQQDKLDRLKSNPKAYFGGQ